jgi:hypothetical protein
VRANVHATTYTVNTSSKQSAGIVETVCLSTNIYKYVYISLV